MKFLPPPIGIFALAGLLGCTAGQTDKAGSRTLKASATTTLTDSSSTSTMAIEAGSLKDTTIDIPGGALAIGTSVDVRRGTVPDDFAISESTAASSPLVVTASNGGNPLSEAQSSMKIAIPVTATGLALMADSSKLSALCKDVNGNLFIWGRDKIALVDGKAIFQSKRFGTYQLRYIPDASSTDFASTEEEAPEEKSSETTSETKKDDGGYDSSSENSGAEAIDPDYVSLQVVMNRTCAHTSCHGAHEGQNNFLQFPQAFANKKEIIKQRLFEQTNMPPPYADAYKPNSAEKYDPAANSLMQTLNDQDKAAFGLYLQKIGVSVPNIPNPPNYP